MKRRRWTVERVAQAYREQGVPWSEDQILAKAAEVAREMARWDIRWHNEQRKFYRNEIPCGLANAASGAYDYATIAAQHERLRREDWTGEQRAGKTLKAARLRVTGRRRAPTPRLSRRRKTSRDFRRDERQATLNGKECG